MIANKFFLHKTRKKEKKTHSQVHLTDSLEKLVQTETRVLFFNARGQVFKVTVRDPETRQLPKFSIIDGNKNATRTWKWTATATRNENVSLFFLSFFFFCTETTITNDPVACNEGPRRVTTETSCRYPFVSFRGCTTSAISLQTRFHRANNNYAPPMYRPTMLTGNAHPIKLPRSRRTPTTWMAVSPSPKP